MSATSVPSERQRHHAPGTPTARAELRQRKEYVMKLIDCEGKVDR